MTKMNLQKGSSTIELLIAFTVLVFAVSACVIFVFGNQSLAVDTQTSSEALYRAQSVLESTRALSRQDFTAVSSQAPVNEVSGAITYTKKLDVLDVDTFTKQATSTVTWQIGPRSFTVVLSTLLTNPASALGGDTCSPTLTGDWTSPQLLGYGDFPSPEGATGIDVLSRKAYVTTNPSSAGAPDFYIFNVTDPNQTHIPPMSSLDTGIGLAAVRVAGKYAYVANVSATKQLQVIDISNPSSPSVVSQLDVTSPSDTAVGNTIFYDQKRVYLGLDSPSSGAEFYVIDVTNPLNPLVLASYETNTKVNAIREKDGVAYLAVPDNASTPIAEQVIVLDVSQASAGSITLLGSYSYPNASTMSGQSLYLSKDGKTLYMGRGGANPAHNPNFFDLQVTTPSSITANQSKYISTSNNITVGAMQIRDHYAFLLTSDTNLGFQVWDLNNLSAATPYGSLNVQQSSTSGMDCEGNYIYIGQSGNRALQILGPFIPFVYTLAPSNDITVVQGQSGASTITASLSSGTAQNVTFSASGLPAGATATFSQPSCTPSCTTSLTISTSYPSTPPGTYPITITGTGGTTATLQLVVQPDTFDYSISASPSALAFTRTSPGVVTITITKIAGVAHPVTVSLSGFPSNVSGNPGSAVCTPSLGLCTVSFTISISSNAKRTGTITVTGSSPTRTTSFTISAN